MTKNKSKNNTKHKKRKASASNQISFHFWKCFFYLLYHFPNPTIISIRSYERGNVWSDLLP